MSEEMDVIQHLLEIEREASEVLIKAQEEADKKIAAARMQSDSLFKQQFDSFTKGLDESMKSKKADVQKEEKSRLESFKNELDSTTKDNDSFNALLEKLITA